ncbi:hypothetical protein FRC08_002201 [Ceratobasidium sp. 394]|nr:hypothetical protein FRC08_002201 [Ceratobasidium sp. 394]
MASQHPGGEGKRARHRIEEIKLEPATCEHDVAIKILIDGKKIRELPEIKKGKLLCWGGLSLPWSESVLARQVRLSSVLTCTPYSDVYETSTIAIRIIEIHMVRDRRESATYQMAQVVGQDTISIGSVGGKYTAKVVILNGERAERAYQEAFTKARRMETQRSVVERTGRVGTAFKTLLALGSTMAELDPTGGAKVVFAVCTKAWECLEEQDQQNKKLNKLVEDLAGMIPSLELVKRFANANLGVTVMGMLDLIEDVSLFILSFYSRSPWAQMLSFGPFDSGAQDQIAAFVVIFERLRKEFDTRMAAQMLETVQVEVIRSRLKPVDLAGYDSTRACMPDTRLAAIRDITDWIQESSGGRQLAWVHGLAGLGKSSIATSVCEQLDERGMLAASFFCKRDSPELRDPHRVLTTIAYGLALRYEPYGEAITTLIGDDPEACSKHLQPLCDTLLVKPLQQAAKSNQPGRVLTVLVDALDECGTIDTRKQLITCLHGLSQAVPWLRVVVTSRPDPDIQECFTQLDRGCYTPYNVLGYDSLPDIRVFVRARLSEMEPVGGWPKDAADKLSERSSGLFIWARTACEFVTHGPNPCRRLNMVLTSTHQSSSSAQLDNLYTTAIKTRPENEVDEDFDDVLRCLGAVIVTATRTPLSIPSLAQLLRGRISERALNYSIQRLSSVLYIDGKRDNAVRVSHPSFMDYIIDYSRSKELCVDLEKQNTMIAECCLETMTKELRFNICDLETSHLLNQEVSGLDARIRDAIGGHLSYSCIYWTNHFVVARKQPMDDLLRAFLFELQLLYWIEALSLLGKLSVALSSLLELSRTVDIPEDCQLYAHDVYRFVLSFYDPISESTPHLYVSALPLAPENSKMVRRIRNYFPNTFTIIEGAEQEWTPCLRTISAESEIFAAVFSPNGRRIATGSWDGTVRVWDAEAGATLLEPIRGHLERVVSVAFSPDSRRIVSGSEDETVRVWDAETGVALLGPLQGHSGWVTSVAFSSDGRRIVSGSHDKTVRIWDAETGVELLQLQGHSDAVCSVAFSPDSHRLVSGSADKTVRVWDADTGASLLKPLRGHSAGVWSVAFSPDGDHIVSGSEDETIWIWDAETGAALLQPLRGHSGRVHSVAFSHDSHLIFSGSSDNTVRIWDAETGTELVKPLLGHSSWVRSVAPSPDGRRLVSGSWDKTLRIWDIEMRNVQSKWPQGHSAPVRSVAFSPNGQRIVSGSDDKTVRVWDAETGNAVLEPLQGHSGGVYSVAFSPDGYRIVSGSEDKTLRIWDAETGVGLLELHGHSGAVNSVAFSPDGYRIISGSDDETIRIWDAETGTPLLEPLQGHYGSVSSVALSPDGGRIASGSSDKTVQIWDATTGAMFREPPQHPDPVRSVAYAPNGHHIVSLCSTGSVFDKSLVLVWNVEGGVLRDAETEAMWDDDIPSMLEERLEEETDVMWGAVLFKHLEDCSSYTLSVAFSPDGRHIVSGLQDCAMQVWNTATAVPLLEPLRGHSSDLDHIHSVAFSPDGHRIVSGSDDRTIRVWDINTCAGVDSQTRFLPGARIPVTSGCADFQLVSTSSLLARHCTPGGWVTTPDGGLFLWLPLDLREIDDSSICISFEYSRRRMVMDFANFVHGSMWSSVG